MSILTSGIIAPTLELGPGFLGVPGLPIMLPGNKFALPPPPKEIKTSWIGPGPAVRSGPAFSPSFYNIPAPPANIWAAAPNLASVFYVLP